MKKYLTFFNFRYQFGQMIGCILLGSLFFISGILKVSLYSAVATKLGTLGLPFPVMLTGMVICVEVVCGAMLALHYRARWAAVILILFTIPATLMFHAFWAFDGAAFSNQINHFLKNIAIIGALLIVACTENK